MLPISQLMPMRWASLYRLAIAGVSEQADTIKKDK